jgi:hypothetical protein
MAVTLAALSAVLPSTVDRPIAESDRVLLFRQKFPFRLKPIVQGVTVTTTSRLMNFKGALPDLFRGGGMQLLPREWCFIPLKKTGSVSCLMRSASQSVFHCQSLHLVFASTHGKKGDPFIALVPNDAVRPGVKHRTVIHKEQIFVMAMRKFDAGHPATIRHPLHRIRCALPFIEIPDKADLLRVRRMTEEINVVAGPLRRVW